jgi:hypothetical protein
MALSWDSALIEPVPGFLADARLPMLSPTESDEALHTLDLTSTIVPGIASTSSTVSFISYGDPSLGAVGCEGSLVAGSSPVNVS